MKKIVLLICMCFSFYLVKAQETHTKRLVFDVQPENSPSTNDDFLFVNNTNGVTYKLDAAGVAIRIRDAFPQAIYTQEEIEDFIGAMIIGGDQTNVVVTYDDATGTIDFNVTAGTGGTDNQAISLAGNTISISNSGSTVDIAAATAVVANTAKTTNATHTGEVTGSGALTITNNAVSNAKLATVATQTIKGRNTAATGNVEDLTGSQVKTIIGLANVDNTSDVNKPVSTATQTALNLKANLASPTFTGTVSGITKTMVGLSNVDNTSDINKPLSTATTSALNGKQNILSLTNTGTSGVATLVGSALNIPNYNANISITDSGSYYISSTIEGALQEIGLDGLKTSDIGVNVQPWTLDLDNVSGTNSGNETNASIKALLAGGGTNGLTGLHIQDAGLTAAKILFDNSPTDEYDVVYESATGNLKYMGDRVISNTTGLTGAIAIKKIVAGTAANAAGWAADATRLDVIIDKVIVKADVTDLTTTATTYSAGALQTFQANATNAGFRLVGVTADPSSLTTGQFWLRTDLNQISWYNGTSVKRFVNVADIISFTSSRNIASTDIRQTLACTTSATLTVTLNFSAMNIGDWINLEAHGTTLTVTGAASVTINGTVAGSATVGATSYRGGIIRKTGTNTYIVL